MDITKITSAVTTAAGKVLKMKTSHKIALGAATAVAAAATGAVIAKTAQARRQERSVKSLLMEDAAKRIPSVTGKDKSFEESLEESAQPFVLPNAVRKNMPIEELDDFDDTFVLQPREKTSESIIFYLHGSNFWGNPSKYHYAFIRRLSNKLGMELVLPVYPKAPAHVAVDIQQMLLERYMYLVDTLEYPAENIVFIGDACGGALALALMQKLRYLGLPLPGRAFLISPWLDLTLSNPMIEEIQPNDSVLNAEKLFAKGEAYAGSLELTHPVVSPIYGDLCGLPPITVFAGSREIFSADALRLKEIADENQLDIDVNIYKNQMHFFVGLPIPESEIALAVMASELYGVEEVDELPDEAADEENSEEEASAQTDEEIVSEEAEVSEDTDAAEA